MRRVKSFREILTMVFGVLILFTGLVGAQNVTSYPEGKTRDMKGKIERDIIVAKDGSGDFLYISEAIEAIRVYLPQAITVYIKEGVYKEKLEIPGTISNVTFQGDGAEKTIITFDDHAGKNKMDTFDTYTLLVWGSNLVFRDLTIQNTAGNVGQAVALHAEGDRLIFENCHFKGNQDTIFASGEHSRQYYKNCYIEGTTDFIFGSATAVFENCDIFSKSNSYITAASTPKNADFGFVFLNSRLKAAEGINEVYLGRPWRDYSKTVFINCELGDHILPEAWHNWNRPEAEATILYAEGNSTGPGKDPSKRVSWAKVLSSDEISQYTLSNIFKRKDVWEPPFQ